MRRAAHRNGSSSETHMTVSAKDPRKTNTSYMEGAPDRCTFLNFATREITLVATSLHSIWWLGWAWAGAGAAGSWLPFARGPCMAGSPAAPRRKEQDHESGIQGAGLEGNERVRRRAPVAIARRGHAGPGVVVSRSSDLREGPGKLSSRTLPAELPERDANMRLCRRATPALSVYTVPPNSI